MDDEVGRHGTNGTVFTVVVFENVQKMRRRHSCEFMLRAVRNAKRGERDDDSNGVSSGPSERDCGNYKTK